MKMNAITDLPFDWAPDMPGCRIVGEPRTGEQMHARATELATAAMEAVDETGEGIVTFRQMIQEQEDAQRLRNQVDHAKRNAAAHQEAVERRRERMNVHAMRNAEAQAEAETRKSERMAAHEARNEASRKVA